MMSTENQMRKRNGKWGYIGVVYHSKKQPGLDADVAASLPRRLRHALCLEITCKATDQAIIQYGGWENNIGFRAL